MKLIFENEDFMITISDTKFDKFVIYCNSAAGLDRIGFNRIEKTNDKKGNPICGIFTQYGINEINFWCKTANWYQRDSVKYCIEIIRSLIKGHEQKTVIYGTSMGGFGAINFGPELGITSVAFSPQVTLAKEFNIAKDWYLPLEYAEKKYGGFKSNIIDGKCKTHKMFVFYDDSHFLDIKHADWISKNCNNCTMLHVAGGGHGLGRLNKIYPFKRIILEVLNDTFDKSSFYNKVECRISEIVPCILKEYNLFGICLYKRHEYQGVKKVFWLNHLVYTRKIIQGKKIRKFFR